MSTFKSIQVGVIPLFLGAGCLPSPSPGTDDLISASGTSTSTGPAETSATDSPTDTSVVTSTGTSTDADSSTSVSSSTSSAVCGDTIVDAGEECDDGDMDETDECLNDCTLAACGDGKTQVGVEECDDGDMDETDECLNDCTLAVCGDGKAQVGVEGCDDGDMDETDECLNDCTLAVCGDGKVQVGVEGCDDKNSEDLDECNNACQPPRYVFVTSNTGYNGNLKGVGGADDICQGLAKAASLPGGDIVGTYKAWLTGSNPTTAPATRFNSKEFLGWYLLPTQPPRTVARGWTDLTSLDRMTNDYLKNAIDSDETGAVVDGRAWTNTGSNGEQDPEGAHCSDWLSSSSDVNGAVGQAKVGILSDKWTKGNLLDCSLGIRLYCFQTK